jgi:hypothetical protein
MVTIHSLEVSLEVEGEGDEAAFARLFEKHMARWSRAEAQAKSRERRLESDRTLVDRSRGEAYEC